MVNKIPTYIDIYSSIGLGAWLGRPSSIRKVGGSNPRRRYIPYPRHVARRQVCSRHTVSLDIGLSHPHTPGIIHDDAHTIALPSVCRYRLVIIAKVVEDLLCMKFMWLQCDAAGIARRVALVARPSLITLKSSSCTYLLFLHDSRVLASSGRGGAFHAT